MRWTDQGEPAVSDRLLTGMNPKAQPKRSTIKWQSAQNALPGEPKSEEGGVGSWESRQVQAEDRLLQTAGQALHGASRQGAAGPGPVQSWVLLCGCPAAVPGYKGLSTDRLSDPQMRSSLEVWEPHMCLSTHCQALRLSQVNTSLKMLLSLPAHLWSPACWLSGPHLTARALTAVLFVCWQLEESKEVPVSALRRQIENNQFFHALPTSDGRAPSSLSCVSKTSVESPTGLVISP